MRQVVSNSTKQQYSQLIIKNYNKISPWKQNKSKEQQSTIRRHAIGHGVREVCSLPPTLFNIYTNDVIINWKKFTQKALLYQQVQTLNNLCFADDQVITACSEDNLQIEVFTLQHIAKAFGMEISPKELRQWRLRTRPSKT
jgi:hypothetical protein